MLDENIVHPKRFLIMTFLFIFKEMVESDLCRVTGIDWGSLSTHLARLERVGYLERRKAITRRGIRTVVRITEKGYRAYRKEVEKIKALIGMSQETQPSSSEVRRYRPSSSSDL